MTNTSDFQSIVERLERVERRYGHLKRAALACFVVAVGAVLMGQASATKTVEANEFVLRDAGGTVRAKLFIEGGDPQLVFYDAGAKVRASLGLKGVLSALALFDGAGKPRAMVTVGADVGALMELSDANGNSGIQLGTTDDEGPALGLYDAAGKMGMGLDLGLEANAPQPRLRLYDRNEKARIGLIVVTNGEQTGSMLDLFQSDGKPQVVIGGSQEGGLLQVYDRYGRVVQSVPKK